jgi:hypothetical protein
MALVGVALVIIVGCRSSSPAPAEVTRRVPWPGQPMPKSASQISWVHASGRLCGHDLKVAGIRFNLDVEWGHNTVVYLQTLDPRFRTPEGLSLSNRLRDALAAGGTLAPGEGCGVLLPSGWVARSLSPVVDSHGNYLINPPCSDQLLDAPIEFFDASLPEGDA